MKRVTEEELMTDPDQVKAYMEADFSLSEESMVNQLAETLRNYEFMLEEPLILDLGCGPGNISERIASRWRRAKVYGIDDSIEMIRVANERKRLNDRKTSFKRLVYKKMNISSLTTDKSLFKDCADVVVSNSLIHHIHDPSSFFSALINISKNGAIHFHRDLRRPNTFEEVLDIQKRNLVNAPEILVRDFTASLLAAHTCKEVEGYIESAGIKNLSVYEKDDRYIDIVGYISK